jgi:hypothetical protein
MYTAIAAAILMIVALVLMISYRPPHVTRPGPEAPANAVHSVESVVPLTPPVAGQPAPVQPRASAVEIARSAAASIDTLVSRAAEKWLRATELSPQGIVTHDNADDAAAKLQKAVILADSARHDIALARQQPEVVLSTSRDAESGVAFRLGVLYTAADRYLKSIEDDAEDRYEYYAKSQASVDAVLAGDTAESETQQNVANSYLRSSEERQAGIRRLAEQMREALGNIENADR